MRSPDDPQAARPADALRRVADEIWARLYALEAAHTQLRAQVNALDAAPPAPSRYDNLGNDID